jgi:prepilin-type N-terminal cleavage/methylation domain-containing protein
MQKINLKRSQKGFSLLEVLAAIAITGIIVVGIYMALSTSTKVLVRANTQETAKDMAASAMEWILSQQYNSSYTLPSSMTTSGSLSVVNPVVPEYIRMSEQKITITVQGLTPPFTLTDIRANY